MFKIIKDALKYFAFMFVVLELIPYVIDGGNLLEIALQTIIIIIFALAISLKNNKNEIYKNRIQKKERSL